MSSNCFHCGLPVLDGAAFPIVYQQVEQTTCCAGCQAVAQSIIDAGLDYYYAQRTVDAEKAALSDADIDPLASGNWKFHQAVGCGTCRGTGYRGRRAIAELLVLNDEIRELIIGRAPIRQLKEAARRGGTRSLRESALDFVRDGVTSLEEANRVTFVA